MAVEPNRVAPVGPSAPNLTLKDLRQQFWADAYGKEVQTAATYSYTWLADQFGHIAIGLVAHFFATIVAGRVIVLRDELDTLPAAWPRISFDAILVVGLVVALISLFARAAGWLIALVSLLGSLAAGWLIARIGGISWLQIRDAGLEPSNLPAMLAGVLISILFFSSWELSAYRSSIKKATGTFPLDTKLLRDNAVIATVYMELGAVLSFAFHLRAVPPEIRAWIPQTWATWIPSPWVMSWLILFVVVAVAIVLALPWLREKIIWQKAALPYLCRLGDAAPTIGKKDARELQKLIDVGAPPVTSPCAVLIGGPIGSGRTSMAAGIGTEFAFKNCKVRYLTLDRLLEFAASASGHPFPDELGPKTISYWPWSEAQIVIIDDVGPLIAAEDARHEANVKRFKKLIQNDLKSITGVLAKCHTVWVFGDLRPDITLANFGPRLTDFAKVIQTFCSCKNLLIVELGEVPERPRPMAPPQVRWLDSN